MIYKFELVDNLPLNLLKKKWVQLEAKLEPHFFLSWDWIGTWLESYKFQYTVISAYNKNQELVSLAIFTKSVTTRHSILKSTQLKLHQTGVNQEDQIWIEYNNFLVDPKIQQEIIHQGLSFIAKYYPAWDELIISMTEKKNLYFFSLKDTNKLIQSSRPSYSVNLLTIQDGNYLASLSRNTRYQINKSIKEYKKEFGELTLKKAQNIQEALQYFYIAGKAHKLRWSDSGFKNNLFIRFHKNLINKLLLKKRVDFFLLLSGKEVIGASYNLISNKTVYFYLNGLFYHQNNKFKPGLVLHSMIIQHYLNIGFETYDFMGGCSQYKRSLSNESSELITICLQKKKTLFLIENIFRAIKNKLLLMLNSD